MAFDLERARELISNTRRPTNWNEANLQQWLMGAILEIDRLEDACNLASDEIVRLQEVLVNERVTQKISQLCHCTSCCKRRAKKNINIVERARKEALEELRKENKLYGV